MGDMKKLLENWHGYEKGVLNELDADGRANASVASAFGSSLKALNTLGLPTAEEIEKLRNLSDEDLADLNTIGQTFWDNMTPEEIKMLNSDQISQMGPKQAEDAALRLRRTGDWDMDLMRQLNNQSISTAKPAGLTRADIEDIANFGWSDLIHDPDDPIDNAMLATQAGLMAVPGGQAGAVVLRGLQSIGGGARKLYKGAKLLKKYKSIQNAQLAAKLQRQIKMANRIQGPGSQLAGKTSLRLRALEQGKTLQQLLDATQKTFTAEKAEDVVSATSDLETVASSVTAAKKTSTVDKAITALDVTAIGGAAWVGTGLTPDPFSPSGEVTPVTRKTFAPANSADGDPANDTENATDPHPGESGTSAGSTQGTSTSQNATPPPAPAPLNPTPDPSGECPDGKIWVSSPLGGGCQTPAKTEGYDIKKIIAEELESFFNKREL
tara:strand:- start:866 stop:2179 length:1314 start_codon:yes stop_codon:yes gene_type:complete